MEPRPKGDPAALRAVSAQLSSHAARFSELAAVVTGLLPIDVFIGPGRAAHDAEFDLASARARAASKTLSIEAKLLASEAGELQRKQEAWDRRKQAEDERRHREAEQARQQCIVRP